MQRYQVLQGLKARWHIRNGSWIEPLLEFISCR